MKYFIFACTFSCLAANFALSANSDEVNYNQDNIEQYGNYDQENLNLQDGNSSNMGWWNFGRHRTNFYNVGYGHGCCHHQYTNCGCPNYRRYHSCGFNNYSWGYYNPMYLYRVPPMVE
ncbi:MAG: hypothetical protein H6731_11150 [Myxococcales bacterium]|nr:MAG: hypothetical protein H6731_11150 [Myxococcales bacterium]